MDEPVVGAASGARASPRMIVLSVLLLVAVAVIWAKGRGIHVEITPAAFGDPPGVARFEARADTARVLLPLAPGGVPADAAWMRRAAALGVPVDVSAQVGGRMVPFAVSGLSGERDLVVPCKSRAACAELLTALGFALPPELEGAR